MSGRYISPYNLEERVKRLDRPGLPAMPCICDPECICADLCAGDPTLNCLCEENGLFCRVTEGWDIDELDVPDRVGLEQIRFVSVKDYGGEEQTMVESASPNSPTFRSAVQLATINTAQLKRHQRYLQPIAPSAIEMQHDIPETDSSARTSVAATLLRPASKGSSYRIYFDTTGNPLVSVSKDLSQSKSMERGSIRKLLTSFSSNLRSKFQRSKSFDGELIDRMIRPSPFKRRQTNRTQAH